MLSKLFSSLYLKIFVNIVISKSKTKIYIESSNKKGIINSTEELFDTQTFNVNMQKYIESFTKESPFFYISILDYSLEQGAIPTCSKHQIENFGDLSSSEHKCYDNKWSFFTLKSDLYSIEKEYAKIGVDFIFSPFVLLANFFKDKINSDLAIFLLVEEGSCSLSIFKDSKLLYAKYLELSLEMQSEELDIGIDEEIESEESIDDLGTIDLDEMESLSDIDELDDFTDIEDLDSIEEINEFDDSHELEEELAIEEESLNSSNSSSSESKFSNQDYQRFLMIQASIDTFYKDTRFKGEFLENVYIADSIGLSRDLKRYLEEEMFLNVYIRSIDLSMELCEVAKMEIS